ncbi:MAG: bifunctional ornithine acetyltransferase/N-acetylglutamate synthase [Rhodospirillaceae bacterium]|nr:bifunctional ornithine acetyltransferase/N-acetylglutamate synthase [Rhodospirillaceae bacterium]
MPPRSPLAPAGFPDLRPIAGVRLGATSCGIRYRGRTDLTLAILEPGTTVAGVFTLSSMPSAPVDWCRTILPQGHARGLVVNSGNANAFTGSAGKKAVEETARAAATMIGCSPSEIYLASTGVIGEPLPFDKIVGTLPSLNQSLTDAGWEAAANGIMTTDTFPKGATRSAKIDGRGVTINGIAKGSGMIAPHMGTMLGFIFTDAAIPAPVLQLMVRNANRRTFNAVTVDSDTSTSDTVLCFATGQVPVDPPILSAGDRRLVGFRRALEGVMTDLAQQIVRDGEGATKFVTVTVGGAQSRRSAERIARAIADSPLVKTAVAGEDANWGRIVMAVGKSGEKADRDRLRIAIGGIVVAENGMVRPGYEEAPVATHMKGQEIDIEVDVGVGGGVATVWTCDLTHRYIDINASYRS